MVGTMKLLQVSEIKDMGALEKVDKELASMISSRAARFDGRSGAKPPSSPTAVVRPRSFKTIFRV